LQGFFLKNRGEHEEAVKNNEVALEIRETVFGMLLGRYIDWRD
jgi:hypothetical protein